jgi:hypothetical protein
VVTGSCAEWRPAVFPARVCGPAADVILEMVITVGRLSRFETQRVPSMRLRKGCAGRGWQWVTCFPTLEIKLFAGLFRKLT